MKTLNILKSTKTYYFVRMFCPVPTPVPSSRPDPSNPDNRSVQVKTQFIRSGSDFASVQSRSPTNPDHKPVQITPGLNYIQ